MTGYSVASLNRATEAAQQSLHRELKHLIYIWNVDISEQTCDDADNADWHWIWMPCHAD